MGKIGSRGLGKYYGLPEVVFKRRRRVVLPAMLPLARLCDCGRRRASACPQSSPTWTADEPARIQNSGGLLQLSDATLRVAFQSLHHGIGHDRQTIRACIMGNASARRQFLTRNGDPNLPRMVVWPRLVQLRSAAIPREDHQAILP